MNLPALINRLMPPPVKARHCEYSMLISLDDESNAVTPELMDIAMGAIAEARKVSMSDITARMQEPPYYPEVWPGEHYKLLAGLVSFLKPKLVIEVGTATGMSALALKKYLPAESKLVTYDVIPWQEYPSAILKDEDFADGRLVQKLKDITIAEQCQLEAADLFNADLFFIDAAKDGLMEQRILENFHKIKFAKPPLLIFDDIRLWNMLKIWRDIDMPKMDLTSFGHWCGTGLVRWQP